MKLLLLDKDGTLVQPKSSAKFVNKPEDQEPLPGVIEVLDRYVSDGWLPLIISNQGSVAAGHKTLEDATAEMRLCLELLPQIKEAFFCPDYQGDDCWRIWGNEQLLYGCGWTSQGVKLSGFRKPDPGMIELAIDLHVPDKVLYVSDRPEDEQAAAAANIPFKWATDWVLPF